MKITVKDLYGLAKAKGIEDYEVKQFCGYDDDEFNILMWEIDHENKVVYQVWEG